METPELCGVPTLQETQVWAAEDIPGQAIFSSLKHYQMLGPSPYPCPTLSKQHSTHWLSGRDKESQEERKSH